MKEQMELRLAGSGGMGVILATIILAEAALKSGHSTVQSQSYGPEARGGMCKAEVIISEGQIDCPKVTRADFLLALTQASLNRYAAEVKPGAMLLMDDDLTPPENFDGKVVRLPILKTARDVLKKPMTVNIVTLGAMNALLHLFEDEALEEAMLAHVPKGTEDLNRTALQCGRDLVARQSAAMAG